MDTDKGIDREICIINTDIDMGINIDTQKG